MSTYSHLYFSANNPPILTVERKLRDHRRTWLTLGVVLGLTHPRWNYEMRRAALYLMAIPAVPAAVVIVLILWACYSALGWLTLLANLALDWAEGRHQWNK